MADEPPPLFRPEVSSNRNARLNGPISIGIPLSWSFLTALLGGLIVVSLFFVATASYSKVEIASGRIVPDRGLIGVVPQRAGVVAKLMTHEGAAVRRGQKLMIVSADQTDQFGQTTQVSILAAISRQQELNRERSAATRKASADEVRQGEAQLGSLASEASALNEQIRLQERLVASSVQAMELTKEAAGKGFVSGRDMRDREDLLVVRRQRLAELGQIYAAKRGELENAIGARKIALERGRAAGAEMMSDQEGLSQQFSSAQSAMGYSLIAPVDGIVTALTAHTGYNVLAGDAVMSIIPTGSRMQAELYIPTSAIGFVSPGQEVRLMIDAFSYERFGTVKGTLTSVSRAAIMHETAKGVSAPAYRAIVSVERGDIYAAGRRRALAPGMTLSARIVTEKRSVLRWMLQPFFTVQKR